MPKLEAGPGCTTGMNYPTITHVVFSSQGPTPLTHHAVGYNSIPYKPLPKLFFASDLLANGGYFGRLVMEWREN